MRLVFGRRFYARPVHACNSVDRLTSGYPTPHRELNRGYEMA